MALHTTTDHGEITAALDRFLADDPVAGTVLGTIRGSLAETAWAATDGARLAVRSAAEYPVAVTGDWGPDTHAELVAVLGELASLRGLSGSRPLVEALAARLLGTGRQSTRIGQGLYRCDQLILPVDVDGVAVRADAGDRRLVRDWFFDFAAETGDVVAPTEHIANRLLDDGVCWLWRDATGRAVALAGRRTVVAGSARVGPVYTPPDVRGRGYGSAVTAAATRDILEHDAVPVLFTDLTNPTSNKIYRQLGYRLIEQRLLVTLD